MVHHNKKTAQFVGKFSRGSRKREPSMLMTAKLTAWNYGIQVMLVKHRWRQNGALMTDGARIQLLINIAYSFAPS